MKPRLILFEFHHMGDALLSFPFIRAASTFYEIWVCCRPQLRDVFEMVIPAEQVLVWEPFWIRGTENQRSRWEGPYARLQELKAEVSVCAWADARVHGLMALSGAKVRIGFPMNDTNYFTWKAAGVRNRLLQGRLLQCLVGFLLRKKLLTQSLQRQSWIQPHWQDWLQVGQALGLEVSMSVPWVDREFHGKVAGKAGQTRWLLHLGARLPEKRWSAEGFARIVQDYLNPTNHEWVCVAPGDEVNHLPDCLKERRVETSDWKALIDRVSAVDAVLCHDSAVAHLAVALGKRVVALFGPRPSCWFAPYGNEHLLVSSSEGLFSVGEGLRIESDAVIAKMRMASEVG
jgi:ADP-heptose:LPS heptosyltransferase